MLSLVSASTSFMAPVAMAPQPQPQQFVRTDSLRMQARGEIPGLKRPDYLDGMLPGDWGLDPLNLVTKYSTVEVPAIVLNTDESPAAPEFKSVKTVIDSKFAVDKMILGPNTADPKRALMWMREAEIKHARLAMLAAAGWPLAEMWHGAFSKITASQYLLDASQGRSLSVLNGGLGQVVPFLLLASLLAAVVEVRTLDQVYGLTATGKTMKPNGQLVMKSYTPGDCGFDPLNLYGWYGQNWSVVDRMRGEQDPEFAMKLVLDARREMETAEINNGRCAMLGITGFALQEAVYGTPVVDQTPIFFTFFGELLAPGAIASLGLY